MSIIKDTFFGGAEKDAARAQERALKDSQAFIREGIADATQAVNSAFPLAMDMQNAGFSGALGMLGDTIGAQGDALQQGSMQAQNTIAGALPAMNAAILGNAAAATDTSFLQPKENTAFNSGLFNRSLPDILQSYTQQDPVSQQPNVPAPNITQPFIGPIQGFGGIGGFTGGMNNNASLAALLSQMPANGGVTTINPTGVVSQQPVPVGGKQPMIKGSVMPTLYMER